MTDNKSITSTQIKLTMYSSLTIFIHAVLRLTIVYNAYATVLYLFLSQLASFYLKIQANTNFKITQIRMDIFTIRLNLSILCMYKIVMLLTQRLYCMTQCDVVFYGAIFQEISSLSSFDFKVILKIYTYYYGYTLLGCSYTYDIYAY